MTQALSLLDQLLSAAIAATDADMGNVQLLDPGPGALKIVASCCFGWRFLQFFDTVAGDAAACGRALQQQSRVVVEDVETSPIFRGTPALEVMRDARALAVQSTPLVAPDRRVMGMISTHRCRPSAFTPAHLQRIDAIARDLAHHVEEARIRPGTFAWSEARSRILMYSAQQLIDGTRKRTDPAESKSP